ARRRVVGVAPARGELQVEQIGYSLQVVLDAVVRLPDKEIQLLALGALAGQQTGSLLLGALAPRDIDRDADDAGQPCALVVDRRARHQGGKRRSVPTLQERFALPALSRLQAGHDLYLRVLGRDQIPDVTSDRLRR